MINVLNSIDNLDLYTFLRNINVNLMLELYVMKVTRTVLRGGKSCEGNTYLNRP